MRQSLCVYFSLVALTACAALGESEQNWTVPGTVRTTWVGNTFKGDSGSADVGRWVQNNIDEIEVTPGGTVLTASNFDENGRTVSLYKDGQPNRTKFKQYAGRGGHARITGWGTSSYAATVWDDHIFIANRAGDLLRFRWKPGQLDSQQWRDEVQYASGDVGQIAERDQLAIGMNARGDRLALIQADGTVQLWGEITGDIKRIGQLTVEGATDVAVAPDGTLWLARETDVVRMNAQGETLATINDAGQPSAVSISPRGELVVCDNGPRQQVRVYDVSGEPTLIRTVGRKGGLRAGKVAGAIEPDKFYGLRGANFDEQGNLYIGMDVGFGAAGTALLGLSPEGEQRWRLNCLAFVDVFDVDPASDGTVLYSTQEVVRFDPDPRKGDTENGHWEHEAMTVDPIRYPEDRRAFGGAQIVRVNGRRLLMNHGQHDGFELYAFEPGDSHIARPVPDEQKPDGGGLSMRRGGATGSGYVSKSKPDAGQAWFLDPEGSIWSGDRGGQKIRRWRIARWDEQGMPVYHDQPDTWPWPDGWTSIHRVVYRPGEDTLYLTGNTVEHPGKRTHQVGRAIGRYDRWTSDARTRRYVFGDLPECLRPLPPKSISVAGDYIFLAAVWHSPPVREGQHRMEELSGRPLMVHVYRAADGEYVGNMWGDWLPLPIVDMRHGMNAFKRANGAYLVLVEDVYRGKNVVYQWTPQDAE